jgi:hypothetical protein
MLKKICAWLCFATLGLSPFAMAGGGSGTLLYIQPFEYSNPIALWNFSYRYWFEQGPIVEKLALEKFSQKFGEVSMCESNQAGKMLVWLQPKMFYNPQLQLFYGKIVANVYTGMGKQLASYKGEAHAPGRLDIYPEQAIEKSYALALDRLIANMQTDTQLAGIQHNGAAGESTPCSMVTLLPVPKVRATSF